jgi:hypothetical protein
MKNNPKELRDLLYLDFDKAASIWSQFDQGLLERASVAEDTGRDQSAGTKFGIPGIAEANLGVDYVQKRSTLHSRTLHHDLLQRVEERLGRAGLVIDLDATLHRAETSAEHIREVLGNRPYLRVSGHSVIEDYRRILAVGEKFNDIVAFLSKAAQDAIKKTPQYVQLQQSIAAARESAENAPDRNQRAIQRSQVKALERQVEESLKPQIPSLEPWLIDGMRLWIDTFMTSRINFRIYPFPECPSFQVLCNLKRDCFVDSDLEHLLYGYGPRPNVPLAVFGLVTSLPPLIEAPFDPMAEFAKGTSLSEKAAFEKAFRGIFVGMEALEGMIRYSRYPNVTVHPIAVYRSFPINAG